MRNFPQEIVDNVIDMLAELESEDGIDEWAHHHNMSPYAMVSRGWVKRVQVHRFRQILFEGEENFSKWCRAIEPRHNTVSCYVKEICWCDMKTLKNFEPHVKALTQVTHLWFTHCDFFCSLYNTNLLEAMASSLVDLEIRETNTRPEVMATFLSHLPRLRRLCVYNVAREPSSAIYVVPHPSIPFFENAGDFEHFFPSGCPSNSLGWVPSTPRFSKLAFGASYVLNYTGVVDGWISSSGESLESLYLMRDRESGDRTLSPLDLSGCTSLGNLRLPVPTNPEVLTDAILPSISSSELTRIALDLDADDELDYPLLWKGLEKQLCRLAKRFKTAHGGRKMVVRMNIGGNRAPAANFENERPMPDLDQEATVEVFSWRDDGAVWNIEDALP